MTNTIIEILIDRSGSMGFMTGTEHENKCLIEGVTRISLIKKILIEQIIPTIAYADKVIIRTFRSNAKKVNEEIIYEPFFPLIYNGKFDLEMISKQIRSISDPPSGGTPISGAIRLAVNDLQQFPNCDRKIILLTDGEENGGGNYLEASKEVEKLPGITCKIFIVGLAQDKSAEEKSYSIANGGYFNIKTKSFANNEVQKIIEPLKIAVLQDTIQNLKTENTKTLEKVNELVALNIDSTTLTIDEDYSEDIRIKSETFLYNMLCEKHGREFVKWLNQVGESYSSHDFEIKDKFGKTILIIECKGTSKNKCTFYLTSKEWTHFLKNKINYQLYRIFNVDGEMTAYQIENLLEAILSEKVVPYLTKPEILKDNRVFLTLNI